MTGTVRNRWYSWVAGTTRKVWTSWFCGPAGNKEHNGGVSRCCVWGLFVSGLELTLVLFHRGAKVFQVTWYVFKSSLANK